MVGIDVGGHELEKSHLGSGILACDALDNDNDIVISNGDNSRVGTYIGSLLEIALATLDSCPVQMAIQDIFIQRQWVVEPANVLRWRCYHDRGRVGGISTGSLTIRGTLRPVILVASLVA